MRNLLAEMARNGVTNADIQKVLGCSEKTVRNKISEETPITFPEAMKIKLALFPTFDMEYLFAPDSTPPAPRPRA